MKDTEDKSTEFIEENNKNAAIVPAKENKIEEYKNNQKLTNRIELPKNVTIKKKNSKITKKTIAWIVGGLLVGVTVGFTVGPAGIMIANIAAGLGKVALGRIANKIEAKELEASQKITENGYIDLPANIGEMEEPSVTLKSNFDKFKDYIKSPEGLRDVSKGLTAFMIGTSIGRFSQSLMEPKISSATSEITSKTETLTTNTTTNSPVTDPYADIRVGDKVGNYNVSTGHDTASWAVNNTNSENLLSDFVNGNSTFKRFAIPGTNGQWQMITEPGMNITEVCSKYGLDPSQIAVDVGNDGVSQAWVSVDDLLSNVTNHVR